MTYEVKTPNFSFDKVTAFNGKTVIVENWAGPDNSDGNFSVSCNFKVNNTASRHCMIVSSRSNVSFGGWNLQKVGNKLSLQIGNGQKWFGARFEDNVIVENDKWYNVAFSVDKKNSKVDLFFNGEKAELVMSGNYRHATNNIYIGGLNQSESNFMFSGEVTDLKIGSGIEEHPKEPERENVDSFNDVPLDVQEFDINNFINVLDQYSNDREWIKSALERLRLELNEEMDLNTKLNELGESDNAFLLNKVEKFMNDFSKEVKDTESELSDIYKKLQTLILDNFNLLNSNKKLKDRMRELNTNGIDMSILNIRHLINENVVLLKNNDRWGDTNDVAFKFNSN
jgi:hypothetical protein